jgi:transcriptional regulator with XRE-family HTH domain
MDETTGFPEELADRLRAYRVDEDRSQDEVARAMRAFGFPGWTRGVVSAFETGKRRLYADELLAIGPAYGTSIPTLFRDAGEVRLSGAVTFEGSRIAQVFAGRGLVLEEDADDLGEPEVRAARSLGIEPDALLLLSILRWGRSLSSERDRRTAERSGPGASARTLQAVRGHVTRELLDELAPDVGPERERRAAWEESDRRLEALGYKRTKRKNLKEEA